MICDVNLNRCPFVDWYPSHIQFDLTEFNPDNDTSFMLISEMLFKAVDNTGRIMAIEYPHKVFDILMEINRQGIEGTVVIGYLLDNFNEKQWNYLPQVALITENYIYKILETTFESESSVNYQFYNGDISTFTVPENIEDYVRFDWRSMK